MRIKHYIVNYNNDKVLNECLESLYPTFEKYVSGEYQCFIINNHTNISIESKFRKYVIILNNALRPDFSTGHLSRNWNQAIINGFKSLENPDCDIVITSQNDCQFVNDFIPNLIAHHEKYTFISLGAGDNFVSYKVESIKTVGLWDERFCNIGFQEADYFLRQLIYNTEKCSINDSRHGRVHNPIENNVIIHTISGADRYDSFHIESRKYHEISLGIYVEKWGDTPFNHATHGWNYERFKSLQPNISSFIYYPYFEKDILTFEKQKYLIRK